MVCFLRHPLLPITALALFSKAVLGFSFTLENTSPKQCEEVEIKWSGGQSPWSLTIIVCLENLECRTCVGMPDWLTGTLAGI